MRYYIRSQLSEHMAETPEGFLVCFHVAVARTGEMDYGPDETPVECAAGETLVTIERHEEDVFHPRAMTSFEGKPVTINHPDEDVTPANWSKLAKGHAQNVRRGEGVESGLVLADLVITDQEAIKLVRGGLREISCGYDADYEQIRPGRGRQRNILGNHIALVNRGRCGPSCRINDQGDDTMSKEKKRSFKDRAMALFKKTLDEMEEESAEPKKPAPEQPATDEGGDDLAALKARVEELALAVRQLTAPKEDPVQDEEEPAKDEEEPGKDPAPKTTDRALAARTVDADVKARAHLLFPHFRIQDSDNACAVMRMALRQAVQDTALAQVVNGALRGSTLDACDCVTLDAAFLAASEVARAQRNRTTADTLTNASVKNFGKSPTPADINQMNQEFHKKGA